MNCEYYLQKATAWSLLKDDKKKQWQKIDVLGKNVVCSY